MTRTKTIAAAAAALIVIGATGLAFANEPYFPRGKRGFERMDTNKDGKISLAELAPIADKGLAKADMNGDKIVTPEEIDAMFLARIAKRRDRMMQLLDGDKNGQITESELDKVVEAMFNTADGDRDGSLTFAEMKSFKRAKWRKAFLGGANGPGLPSQN